MKDFWSKIHIPSFLKKTEYKKINILKVESDETWKSIQIDFAKKIKYCKLIWKLQKNELLFDGLTNPMIEIAEQHHQENVCIYEVFGKLVEN